MSRPNEELETVNQAGAVKGSSEKNASISEEEKGSEVIAQESDDVDSICTKELYREAWTRNSVIWAYVMIFVFSFVETFAGDSSSGFDSYATSSFSAHSLISTAAIVFKIVAIVAYPLMAKLSDFFGRAEGFAFACGTYSLTYVLYAFCKNVSTYFGAEVFFALGKVGFRIFVQIFIADTTSLINRGMWAQLPDGIFAVPSMYVGSLIQDAFLDHSTWRWGYGTWAIIMSVTSIPLVIVMYLLDRKTKAANCRKLKKALAHLPEGPVYKKVFNFVYFDLDAPGMVLLVVGLSLFFVPMTMTGTSSPYRWLEGKLIAMLVVGFVLILCFFVWNIWFAKKPFLPKITFRNRTFFLACLMVALEWCENAAMSVYFRTALQTAGYMSAGHASRIETSKKACYSVFCIVAGVAMKFSKRTKIWVLISCPLILLGHGLLCHFANNNGELTQSKALLFMAEVFIGAGRGTYQTVLQVTIQALAGIEGVPMATAFFLAFTSTGALIGNCIAGGVWNNVALSKLKEYLPDEDKAQAAAIFKSLVVALKYQKGTETRDAIARAYRETAQLIGWIGLGIVGPIVIIMFFIQDVKLTDHRDVYNESDGENLPLRANEEIPKGFKAKLRYIFL